MYKIVKNLTRFKLVAKKNKHVYGGFIKVIIKEGVRAKEGLCFGDVSLYVCSLYF